MNIKKLLIASLTLFTLSITVSCNNKKKTSGISAGLPYTLVETNERLDEGEELTLGFDYTGENMKVYWSDDIETPSTEKMHTFVGKDDENMPYFIIEGNVTSIWFTDKDGNSIQIGNDKIREIIFSNTITSLPKYACASLMDLRTVFIPKSVKKISEYAFTPSIYYLHDTDGIYCEYETRPSTWSPNWYYGPIMGNLVKWGFSYYIFDDEQEYFLYSKGDIHIASYMGYAFPTDVKKVVIPQTIEINKQKFDVVVISDTGYEFLSAEELEINNNIMHIRERMFSDWEQLKIIKFIGDFDYLYFDEYVFGYCDVLTSVTLPDGLVNFPYSMFEGCNNLSRVNIPGTVQHIDEDIFYYACNDEDLVIDITGNKSAGNIPICDDGEVFDYCQAKSIKFVYNGSAFNDNKELTNEFKAEISENGFGREIYKELQRKKYIKIYELIDNLSLFLK